MAEFYDRYVNRVRPGERLLLPEGASLPPEAVASEWERSGSFPEDKLSSADKTDLGSKGYRYTKTEVSITESVVSDVPPQFRK